MEVYIRATNNARSPVPVFHLFQLLTVEGTDDVRLIVRQGSGQPKRKVLAWLADPAIAEDSSAERLRTNEEAGLGPGRVPRPTRVRAALSPQAPAASGATIGSVEHRLTQTCVNPSAHPSEIVATPRLLGVVAHRRSRPCPLSSNHSDASHANTDTFALSPAGVGLRLRRVCRTELLPSCRRMRGRESGSCGFLACGLSLVAFHTSSHASCALLL